MSSKIPWPTPTSISNSGSYTGVPSANFMYNPSMKKPRKSSQSASNGSSEGSSVENGHREDNIPAAVLRYIYVKI